MATHIFTDRMILNVDGPVACCTHNPSRPLVSPSVVSMQYYSKGALHIVYLGFQVGGDRGGESLTSLHIPRILFILIGFLNLVWMDAYGLGVWQHQQRHRVHHVSLFHVLGLGCALAW